MTWPGWDVAAWVEGAATAALVLLRLAAVVVVAGVVEDVAGRVPDEVPGGMPVLNTLGVSEFRLS